MKKVILYLLSILLIVIGAFVALNVVQLPDWILGLRLGLECSLIAVLGGVLYCLRGVYLNRCVHNRWDENWETWYYLRPITSAICGVVAFLFLKAGLVVLDASQNENSGDYGYLAFSFLAGLNVDKFVEKIEDLGKSIFGIDKSRTANRKSDNEKDN